MNIQPHDTWESPPIDLNSPFEDDQFESDILEPARMAIKEDMIRSPILECLKVDEIQNPVLPKINDMGGNPIRLRITDVGMTRIYPYTHRNEPDAVICELNEDYFSNDLIQISQRLKQGAKPVRFITKRNDVLKGETFKTQLTVYGIDYDADNYEYEVVKVSDLNKLESTNPIAA